jgi:photosynthetic reaction center H subunit
MPSPGLTSHIDVAQIVLYLFWAFFAGLIFYLRREDKREGYPLVSERGPVQGFPAVPAPKSFLLEHEGLVVPARTERDIGGLVRPSAGWEGAPLLPLGDPMRDGIGAAAWSQRQDVPDLTFDEQLPKIVPLRVAPGYYLATEDLDPRGMPVVTADGQQAGTVVEAWIDRSETFVRYLEAEVAVRGGSRRVLFPMLLASIDDKRGQVNVASVTAAQFAAAPALRDPDQITLLEEDQVSAYFGGGHLYATPARLGPLL